MAGQYLSGRSVAQEQIRGEYRQREWAEGTQQADSELARVAGCVGAAFSNLCVISEKEGVRIPLVWRVHWDCLRYEVSGAFWPLEFGLRSVSMDSTSGGHPLGLTIPTPRRMVCITQ